MVTKDSYREIFYLPDDILFNSQLNIFINYFSSFLCRTNRSKRKISESAFIIKNQSTLIKFELIILIHYKILSLKPSTVLQIENEIYPI